MDPCDDVDGHRTVHRAMGCLTPIPMKSGFTMSIIGTDCQELIKFEVPKRSKTGYHIHVSYKGQKRKADALEREWNREDLVVERYEILRQTLVLDFAGHVRDVDGVSHCDSEHGEDTGGVNTDTDEHPCGDGESAFEGNLLGSDGYLIPGVGASVGGDIVLLRVSAVSLGFHPAMCHP
jgi:hypothetical protein